MTSPRPLTEPADGVPEITSTPQDLREVAARIAGGHGPIAVDAERASGYRYGQRAYLIQVRRAGAGSALIDPIPLPDLQDLAEAMAGAEWVLHAANQDLPSLAEAGLVPEVVFDTELAGRLLGRERVGLSTMVETDLGLSLAKEHSAADWSTRPLPQDWLTYAALDVEVLLELRDVLIGQLAAAGKLDWALQEFEAVRRTPPPPPRVDPWRRTSGAHDVRDRRGLAIVRELWLARDEAAQRADIAPGRILPDRAIVAAATHRPTDEAALLALRPFSNRGARRRTRIWLAAVQRALDLPDKALPHTRAPRQPGTIPPPRSWGRRHPDATARWEVLRPTIRTLATRLELPQENLLAPDLQRRLAWEPPPSLTPPGVADFLLTAGARAWQVDQVAEPVTQALVTGEPLVDENEDDDGDAPQTPPSEAPPSDAPPS